MSQNPTVAHSVSPYLFPKGTWVYSQLKGLQRWQALVITGRTENLDQFPFEPVYAVAQQSTLVQMVEKLLQRLRLPSWYHQRVCLQHEVKIIHSHFGWQGVADLRLANRLRVPHITAFYGKDLSLPMRAPDWRPKYENLFAHCDLFLVEGAYSEMQLVELGCPAEKITVQHLGIDLARIPFAPRQPENGTVRVLIAGRFVEKKGIPDALRAIGEITRSRRPPKLRVELVGDAMAAPKDQAVKREITAVCEQYNLQDQVKFHGFLAYDQLLKLAQSCHLFMHPSVTAADGDTEGGAPLTIAEMSASGMPILATHHCDIPEMVRDGDSGYLVPERDVAALAERLGHLLNHPEAWPRLGQAGRTHIEAAYDLKNTLPRLESIYDGLVTNNE